jgi:cytochrome o ubiquinol oxidase subunit IV
MTHNDTSPGSVHSYTIGFVFSIVLTVVAFWAAYALDTFAIPIIIGTAILQLLVQLTFFLHVGSTATTRSHVFALFFTVTIIGIVIGGTLWIMSNLERLHTHAPTIHELYEGGIVSPDRELK